MEVQQLQGELAEVQGKYAHALNLQVCATGS